MGWAGTIINRAGAGSPATHKRKLDMFTTIDKALTAVVMGLLSILNLVFGISLGIEPATVQIIISALTPVLVYLIPNKPAVK
jgi:hypothetical protein